jgi:hypothetical protein
MITPAAAGAALVLVAAGVVLAADVLVLLEPLVPQPATNIAMVVPAAARARVCFTDASCVFESRTSVSDSDAAALGTFPGQGAWRVGAL